MDEQYGEISGTVEPMGQIEGEVDMPQGGVSDYNLLTNLPSINGHTLIGDSDFEDIGLHFMTNVELKELLGG